jgi:hypothetical protein
VKLVRLLFLALIALPMFLPAQNPPAGKLPVIVIHRRTIIAFFVGANEVREIDADGNESLSDFQLYAYQAKGPLKKMKVDLLDTTSATFSVQTGTKIVDFHPAQKIGYYFIAPGQEPRVEYGVHTDDQLIEIASRYFAVTAPKP